MARWFITFGVLIFVGNLVWPWWQPLGLAQLPGDMAVDLVSGMRFHLPITTALLLSGMIAGAWALFDR